MFKSVRSGISQGRGQTSRVFVVEVWCHKRHQKWRDHLLIYQRDQPIGDSKKMPEIGLLETDIWFWKGWGERWGKNGDGWGGGWGGKWCVYGGDVRPVKKWFSGKSCKSNKSVIESGKFQYSPIRNLSKSFFTYTRYWQQFPTPWKKQSSLRKSHSSITDPARKTRDPLFAPHRCRLRNTPAALTNLRPQSPRLNGESAFWVSLVSLGSSPSYTLVISLTFELSYTLVAFLVVRYVCIESSLVENELGWFLIWHGFDAQIFFIDFTPPTRTPPHSSTVNWTWN